MPEEILGLAEIKETEMEEPQEGVTETIKSNEIKDDKSPTCDGKLLDDIQGDEEPSIDVEEDPLKEEKQVSTAEDSNETTFYMKSC